MGSGFLTGMNQVLLILIEKPLRIHNLFHTAVLRIACGGAKEGNVVRLKTSPPIG